jgi:saccharopine dehydrogenase-like NADP-dependent oxidoreductase/alanine dehydrogenase
VLPRALCLVLSLVALLLCFASHFALDLNMSSPAASNKSVLILGSGLVSPPVINYLSNKGYRVIIATRTIAKAHSIINSLAEKQQKLITPLAWDVEKGESALNELNSILTNVEYSIGIVLSLLPYIHHVAVAKLCITHKIHFSSTSYVSADMQGLDKQARQAGVILLNECGVDPGLDHMSAQRLIDKTHAAGGKIIGFTSICGGLPAPAANNNPFQYKLSWSPRGVLLASTNTAVYLKNNEVKTVAGSDLYELHVGYDVDSIGQQGFDKLEFYPNRDSTVYREIYNIPEAKTLLRGTYRNPGWCRTMKYVSKYGFTNKAVDNSLKGVNLAQFTARVLNLQGEATAQAAAQAMELPLDDEIIKKFQWLGLFDNKLTVPATLSTYTNLDVICFLFEQKLQYAEGEQDAIVMKHTFDIEYSNSDREQWTSVLIHLGEQNKKGNSSMAITVSLPVAIAIHAILEGRLVDIGVVRPIIPSVYNLILNEMEEYGVKFIEAQQPSKIIIRAETKPGEERVAVSPADLKQIIEKTQARVAVEAQPTRCYSDAEYKAAGAEIIAAGSWASSNASDIVLGLKELPESKAPLNQRHIFFAHCYKNQAGWKEILNRFTAGGGLLYDLEFLNDAQGRRIAAFGRPAGMVGMALGILQYAARKVSQPLKTPLTPFKNNSAMLSACSSAIQSAGGEKPSVIILGALGRCGAGAKWVCNELGIKPTEWDLNETTAGGPFKQLNDYDIVLNAIYLSSPIPPFLTAPLLSEGGKDRRLSVVVDVSCDTSNPHSPLPFYKQGTTLEQPVLTIPIDNAAAIDVIAIDHLPSLIPLESSQDFSAAFTPHFIDFVQWANRSSPIADNHKGAQKNNGVSDNSISIWHRAESLFNEKAKEAAAAQ